MQLSGGGRSSRAQKSAALRNGCATSAGSFAIRSRLAMLAATAPGGRPVE